MLQLSCSNNQNFSTINFTDYGSVAVVLSIQAYRPLMHLWEYMDHSSHSDQDTRLEDGWMDSTGREMAIAGAGIMPLCCICCTLLEDVPPLRRPPVLQGEAPGGPTLTTLMMRLKSCVI